MDLSRLHAGQSIGGRGFTIHAKTTKNQKHVLRHVALYQSEKEQHHSQRVSKLGLKILQLD